MNRISKAIAGMKDRIASKGLAPEKIATMTKQMDMGLDEYCKFQELKSIASMSLLSLEEAQYVYNLLGNSPEHFNAQPLEVKYVLTQLFQELLAAKIKGRL